MRPYLYAVHEFLTRGRPPPGVRPGVLRFTSPFRITSTPDAWH